MISWSIVMSESSDGTIVFRTSDHDLLQRSWVWCTTLRVLPPLDLCSVSPKVGRCFWDIPLVHLSDSSLAHFTYSTGGLFPGLNFVLTTWYNREEQNWAVSMFFAGATLAGAFGGTRV